MDRQRPRRYLTACFALGFVGLAAVAQTAGPPPSLRLALRMVDHLRFSGTRTVEFRRGPNTVSHEEFVVRDGTRLRIDFPKDSAFSGQVIVEDGRNRRHYLPNENMIRVMPPRRDEPMLMLSRALENPGSIKFEEGDGGTVAGRRTVLITASDMSGNLLQRINVDPETGAVLRRVLYDPLGRQIGNYEFSAIDYQPRLDRDLFKLVRRGVMTITPEDDLRRLCKEQRFEYVTLPEGLPYRLESTRSMDIRGESVLAQTFSSRAGRLSLFQVKGKLDPEKLKRIPRNGIRVKSWESNGAGFILFGPISQAELDDLAKRLSTR